MFRRHILIAQLAGLAVSAATTVTYAADTEVTIDNFSFTPATLSIAPGTTVIWTNRDDIPHTITDARDPRATRSPPLDTGERYSRTFATAGTFGYFCSLHPHMTGTVVVR